ncbi:GGDEF domain-containing protein [Actinosynnema sp. ALI-1.44]|uniref:GGDEF domain-containing protein n=1 Tax=Actinosynnema sp. ALI-1.44 TaxID=1933779 RepID=UPI001EDB3082|nr:GGDEF domain-containing protein [Actinosynnema sp. ALI-1.44]
MRYFLTVEATVLGLSVVFLVNAEVEPREWWEFAALSVLAVLQAEASRRIEKARRLITRAIHGNMTSVWTFAGVIVLPPILTGVLITVIYGHLWLRVQRKLGTRPEHRVVFSAAIIILSAYASAGVLAVGTFLQRMNGWPPAVALPIIVIIAALIFIVVNYLLAAMAAVMHGRSGHIIVAGAEFALEIATLCLGALAALALDNVPYLIVLILPPLLVLHRAVLVKQLEELAITDQKTGLLNATAWHEAARNELSRAARQSSGFGVLMVDLDYFKRVNDTYGHLAGDEVLKAIARMLKEELRDYDSPGRFGGEEFAVLIPDSKPTDVVTTAERLRKRVTELEVLAQTENGETLIKNLSASIGVAIYPTSGTTLEQLMLTADSAVYTAKSNGRNQVVTLST